jgi:hypothetical protein
LRYVFSIFCPALFGGSAKTSATLSVYGHFLNNGWWELHEIWAEASLTAEIKTLGHPSLTHIQGWVCKFDSRGLPVAQEIDVRTIPAAANMPTQRQVYLT